MYSSSAQVHFLPQHLLWLLDIKTPTTTAEKLLPMLQQSSLAGILLFPPLVTCSTFSCCSNKCCHSGNLVVMHIWCQYYCKKHGKTRIPPRPQRVLVVFIFGDANNNHHCSKNTMKPGHHQWHSNQHALTNATKVDCCYYFCVCHYCNAMTTAGTWRMMWHL